MATNRWDTSCSAVEVCGVNSSSRCKAVTEPAGSRPSSFGPGLHSPQAEQFQRRSQQGPQQHNLEDEPVWPSEWRAYSCLFSCFLLMFNSWGLVNAYGTFQSYYKQHLFAGRDLLLLNLIGSTESFVVLVLSFVVGRLLDAGYFRYLTGAGAVLVTVAMFTLGVANPGGSLGVDREARNQGRYTLTWLTQGLLLGLGMACFFVSSSQIAATWFKKRKSFAIGIVASGASIAGMVYPMMAKYLIASIGFRHSVFSVAGVVAFTALVSVLFAQPNPSHEFRKPARWLDTKVWVDTHAFRNQAYNWFVVSIAIMFFGFYCIFFNLEEWAAYQGLGYKDAVPAGDKIDYEPNSGITEVRKDALRTFYLLSMMNGASTLGRLGSAYASDHWGALNVHAFVSLAAALLVLLLWTLASSVGAAVAFVILFGIMSGAVIGLPPASVAYILGPDLHAQRKLGQWTGMMYTIAAPFALTGPVIAGHLISQFNQNYKTVQLWSGFCLLLSAFCQMMAVWQYQKHKDDAGPLKIWLSDRSYSVFAIFGLERSSTSSSSSVLETKESIAC